MASKQKVKEYVAYWLQAGKRLICPNDPEGCSIGSVLQGDRYSPEFEACWQYVCSASSGDCHLEGMPQTIQSLLLPEWEVVACARCDMPIPMVMMGTNHGTCPCSDLELWPNFDLPQPRLPVDSHCHLLAIQTRLLAVSIAVEQTIAAEQDFPLAPTLDYDEER